MTLGDAEESMAFSQPGMIGWKDCYSKKKRQRHWRTKVDALQVRTSLINYSMSSRKV